MALQVRRAKPEDVPILARMRWDDTWENETTSAPDDAAFADGFNAFVSQALDSDDWAIWVAETHGSLVAHIYVHLVEMVPRPGHLVRRWGYVSGVYTIPEARNRGIGTRLLSAVVEWAKGEGQEFLLLWPSERSVPFYERAGFKLASEVRELELGG